MGNRSVFSRPSVSAGLTLRAELVDCGLIDPELRWQFCSGGRTNLIWKIGDGPQAMICKLYSLAADSPLFPNDAIAERCALTALGGTGLAPEIIVSRSSSLGRCLVYRHVEGTPFSGDVTEVAQLLRALHRQPLVQDLRRIVSGAAAIRDQASEILKACSLTGAAALRDYCPKSYYTPRSQAVFLHGDVVPGNIIKGCDRLTLIDWQCPAIGHPVEDLATFLSPAMQSLYGGRPLSPDQQASFLEAYGNPEVTRSYLALKPLFHWRMAAHCLWKSERGASDYTDAIQLEVDQLEHA